MFKFIEKWIENKYKGLWFKEGYNQGFNQCQSNIDKQITEDILEINGEKIYIMREIDYHQLQKRVPGGFNDSEITINEDRVSNISSNWKVSKTMEDMIRRLDRLEMMFGVS